MFREDLKAHQDDLDGLKTAHFQLTQERKLLLASSEKKENEIKDLTARIAKLENDLRHALRKIKKYRELKAACTCSSFSENGSSVFAVRDTMETQVEQEIKRAISLTNWHNFTNKCADDRITPMFNLYNNWVIKNVAKSRK